MDNINFEWDTNKNIINIENIMFRLKKRQACFSMKKR